MTYLNRLAFLFIISLLVLAPDAFAQQSNEKLLSGNFVGLKFDQFIREMESQSDYYFYYDQTQFDSLTITVQFKDKTLPAVLAQIFSGSEFRFAIDLEKRVYLSKGRAIQTDLPRTFFEASDSADVRVVDNTSATETKSKGKKVSENRLYEIGNRTSQLNGNANLAGHARDSQSGEPVIGASIYIENPRIGVVTDQYGYYSITLPRGRHELRIKSIGMKDTKRQIMLYSDGKLDIDMEEDVVPLKEVVIEAEKDANVSGMQMGVQKLDIKTMKQVPSVFGEADILKVILTLPGVKSVGESSTGLNVRGGATDQNLILYNDATIYNPSHLFGFFSAFNSDVLKSVELHKSSIPAKYGGRLSSVLEVSTRDGNKKKFAGAGGIGLVTGRLTLEGPIIKDKTSFIVGVRSTYSDWLLRSLKNENFRNSRASFYDVNAHISHEINDKNTVYLTGYFSKDQFKLNSDTLYRYQNQNATLKWKHIFNNKLYSVFTVGGSQYKYNVASEANPVNAFDLDFKINQSNFRADFSYFPVSKHTVDFGVSSIYYKLSPGSFLPRGIESKVTNDVLQSEQAIENAFYAGDRFDITPRFSLYAGLRYSLFNYLGPKDVLNYADGLPKTDANIQDTISYKGGKSIANYGGPEYRLSARYSLTDNASVKVSYNTMRQYIHMLSNSMAISPTDVWKLSDTHIKPQFGDQISLGLYKNFKANTIETSVEVYYKTFENFLDYKGGATLIMNHNVETDVIPTEGKAYGVEVLLKKATGKLNGWVSYTYSRSLLRMKDPLATELINQGNFYPSNFDKPHDFTFIGNYKFSRRFSFSLNFTYSTGRPITIPLEKYDLAGGKRVLYSERNQFRIDDYYRVDFSMNIEGNHVIKKLAHSSWTIAVYNLTGRKNPYSVYFKSENGVIKGYKLSIFGQPIPTITYNFRF